MAKIYNEKDFVGKTFSLKVPAKAYISYLGQKYYYAVNPGENIGKIRSVVVNKNNGKKYFSVWIDPNRTAFFDFDKADFANLEKQGVRTSEQKAKEDKADENKQNEGFIDKIKPFFLLGLLGYAGVSLGKTYISSHGRKK